MGSWFDDNAAPASAAMGAPVPGSGLTAPAGGDPQATFNALFPGETLTPEMLKAKDAEIAALGWRVHTSASGNTAFLDIPGIGIVDVIQDAGGANKKAFQLPGSGLPGGAGGGGGQGAFGAYLQPWEKPFQAPTGTDDPGFQFRLDQGMQALERSAAARGTLLTGGTLKGIQGYAQGLASQEYGNSYGRALGEYGLERQNFWANQDRPFNMLNTVSVGGQNAANQTGMYGSQYANQAGDLLTGIGNANAAGSVGQGNIWSQFPGALAQYFGRRL